MASVEWIISLHVKKTSAGIKQLSEGEQKHLEVKFGAYLKRSINQ